MLRNEIIQPALEGRPPFVLSDAFPGDWLPVPAVVRFMDWPPAERKMVKRARWLLPEAFQRAQRGEVLTRSDLILESGVREYAQLRNNISRASNTTAGEGGLYSTDEAVLGQDTNEKRLEHLTVYARVRDEFVARFWPLVQELATWGYGADRSAGKGQFRLGSELELAESLDSLTDAEGCVALSTFQPAAGDPTDGAWDAFTKYGKLGPDFGLDNVFKRPLILLRPGACFRRRSRQGWLGRAIPMSELLAPDVVAELDHRKAAVVHWAFGLCVPLGSATVR